MTIKFEEISRTVIRDIIREVASKPDQRVSANDILSAMVAKKLVAMQKESFGDEFQLTMPIDVRRQIKEYGANYFGNGIMFNVINFKTKEIEEYGNRELAVRIREFMPAVTKESFMQFLEYLEAIIAEGQINKLRPFDPERGCLVTNLSKMPANKLNFGSGDADFIFPLTIEKNSAAILADKDNYVLRLVY